MLDDRCSGTHESGGSVLVRNFPVCHDKEHTGKEEVKSLENKKNVLLLIFQGVDDIHYNATLFDCHTLCSHGDWK